ncbi:MAG: hypothetical protein ACKOYH_00355 [Cyanobium sp.]
MALPPDETLGPVSTLKPPSPTAPNMLGSDPRRDALIRSLQLCYAAALALNDAEAKRALFREAVYLNIHPDLMEGKVPIQPAALADDLLG